MFLCLPDQRENAMKTIDHAVVPENELDEVVLGEAFKGYFRNLSIRPCKGLEVRLELLGYRNQGWFEVAAHPDQENEPGSKPVTASYLTQMLWKREFHIKPMFRTKIHHDRHGLFAHPPGSIAEGMYLTPEFAEPKDRSHFN